MKERGLQKVDRQSDRTRERFLGAEHNLFLSGLHFVEKLIWIMITINAMGCLQTIVDKNGHGKQ